MSFTRLSDPKVIYKTDMYNFKAYNNAYPISGHVIGLLEKIAEQCKKISILWRKFLKKSKIDLLWGININISINILHYSALSCLIKMVPNVLIYLVVPKILVIRIRKWIF